MILNFRVAHACGGPVRVELDRDRDLDLILSVLGGINRALGSQQVRACGRSRLCVADSARQMTRPDGARGAAALLLVRNDLLLSRP